VLPRQQEPQRAHADGLVGWRRADQHDRATGTGRGDGRLPETGDAGRLERVVRAHLGEGPGRLHDVVAGRIDHVGGSHGQGGLPARADGIDADDPRRAGRVCTLHR
jgi:hypothetical protein